MKAFWYSAWVSGSLRHQVLTRGTNFFVWRRNVSTEITDQQVVLLDNLLTRDNLDISHMLAEGFMKEHIIDLQDTEHSSNLSPSAFLVPQLCPPRTPSYPTLDLPTWPFQSPKRMRISEVIFFCNYCCLPIDVHALFWYRLPINRHASFWTFPTCYFPGVFLKLCWQLEKHVDHLWVLYRDGSRISPKPLRGSPTTASVHFELL